MPVGLFPIWPFFDGSGCVFAIIPSFFRFFAVGPFLGQFRGHFLALIVIFGTVFLPFCYFFASAFLLLLFALYIAFLLSCIVIIYLNMEC